MELHRPTGKIIFAAMLVAAGIGAAVAPFLADLLSAGAGVMVAIAVWTAVRQGAGPSVTTKFVEAV